MARWRRLGATIGEDVFIGPDVLIDEELAPLLTIESGAVVSARCMLLLHDSAYNNVCGLPVKVGRVRIGTEAYVGVNVVVLCGVTIGHHSIIGAGAVVTHDIPDEVIAFGCPARVVGTLSEYRARFESKQKFETLDSVDYWNIMPWRDRIHRMSPRETEESYRQVIDRLLKKSNDRTRS